MANIKQEETKTDVRQPDVCSICQITYYGWGHNAQPVNNGRCCNVCNDTIVIPARLRQMKIGRRA
jgi:hypothetical protein